MKFNILFIPKWYPTTQKPLDGIFIQKHAEAISNFCNVKVLFAEVNPFQKELISSSVSVENNVEVHRYFYKKNILGVEFLDKIIRFYLYFKCLNLGWKSITDKTKIDLIHVHVLLRTGIFAKKIYEKHNIPYIISEHWTGYINGNLSNFKKHFTKQVLKNAKAITTVSKPLENGMKSLGIENNYFNIPNVVDTSVFKPSNLVEEKNIILHISDLKDEHKNISGLIRTIHQLSQKRNDFELHIIGDGEERKQFEKLASELNLLDSKVFFLGALKGQDVIEELQKCRFLSLFSNYETFGVVLIEALACGKPVVASKLDCIQKFITEKQGVLVEPKNEKQLLSAFDEMLDNYSNFNSEELSQYVKSKYSYNVVGKQFYDLYQTILES